MKTFAIIPAGGKGKRSGFKDPKQYIKFSGKELIIYTLETFQANSSVDEIIAAVHKDYIDLLRRLKKKYNLTKLSKIVEGGKERQDSVFAALSSLSADINDLVAVHDAARPLLPQNILTNAIKTAKEKGNALVCIKARDTLLKGNKQVKEYLDRSEVYYVQTPQIFKYDALMKAMKKAQKENFYGTDESMLVKRFGKKINIVQGSTLNFKITTKEDVEIFKKLIKC